MPLLKDIIQEQNLKKAEDTARDGNTAAAQLLEIGEEQETKSKQVNIRLYPSAYEKLKQITKKLGTTPNNIINMLISRYIIENEDVLNK